MNKAKEKLKKFLFPITWILPLIFTLVFNNAIYFGSRMVVGNRYHYNLSGRLDDIVPFVPQFIIVYFGCFVFWIVNYCIISKQDKEHRYRFFTADFYARLICLACFLLFPTTNTRPVLTGGGFWESAVGWLYAADAPNNLFPSIHCMASWFSYIGIRGRQNVPLWYRRFSCVMAFVVFLSTLSLRQHVLIDVIGGVAVAEITYFISLHTNGYRVYMRIFESAGDKIMGWIRGKGNAKQEKDVV